MFDFPKSREDLKNKQDVQYKVMSDWLRSTHQLVTRIERQNKVIVLDIAKLYDLLLKDDSPPEDMELEDADITDTESVH